MVLIGLECHEQLKSDAKLFCRCPANYRSAEPNANVCPVCTSQPGAKPMAANKTALENAVKLALALGCSVSAKPIHVQRKHYFYPDLPSGYQRTSKPIATGGSLAGVRIREMHIEEDPGRYDLHGGATDFNRSGVPLVEIVTEPDMKTPEEARGFLEELQAITGYLAATRDEPGSTRIDANISVADTRVEVKNINSYKGVYTALKYEILRQSSLLQHGAKITQETRHFDEDQGITIALRKKETAEDYRYIPDPDLLPVAIEDALVAALRRGMPEMPRQKAKRLAERYGIRNEDAWVLSVEKEMAEMFEEVAQAIEPALAAAWLRGALKKQLNYRGLRLRDAKLSAAHVAELLQMFAAQEITDKVADQLMQRIVDEPQSPKALAQRLGLLRIGDTAEIGRLVDAAIAENPKAVADYKQGEAKSLNFLAGRVMQKTKGRADPKIVQELLRKKLA